MTEKRSAEGELIRPENADEQLEMWSGMFALERERIASRDRATAAIEAGFASFDAADERQYHFQTDRLARDDKFRNRRLSHTVRIVWYATVVTTVLMGFFVYAILWGTPDQRAAAFTSVSVGGALIAGILIGRYVRERQ